jgi:prepilin-type N-terminal cleavage/methylation domain-containing protein
MIKLLRKLKTRGFTLIELLVVIAIIAILAAVLTPTVTDALTRGKMTGTLSNGRSIHQALFARDIDDPVFQTGSPYPKSSGAGSFANSTLFWRNVVTSGIMRVDFSFFSAPGITPLKGTNAAAFTEANNAWNITADINDSSIDTTPLIFTRNLVLNNLIVPDYAAPSVFTDNPPFGRKGLPTVLKGGSGLIFKPENIQGSFYSGSSNHVVLRP